MNDIMFDKLGFIERLQAGGFNENQSRAFVNALDQALREIVATRADIQEAKYELNTNIQKVEIKLSANIQEVKSELSANIQEVETKLSRNIQEVKNELSTNIQEVKNGLSTNIQKIERELEVVKAELAIIKWLIGGIGFGVLMLLIKSFFPF